MIRFERFNEFESSLSCVCRGLSSPLPSPSLPPLPSLPGFNYQLATIASGNVRLIEADYNRADKVSKKLLAINCDK